MDELLTVEVRDDEGGVTVVVAGEIDIVTSVRLNRELLEVLHRDPPPRLVAVDLHEAPFMDTSGLAVLLSARRVAEESGSRLFVRSPSRAIAPARVGGAPASRLLVRSPGGAIARVLSVTGVEQLLLEP